MTAKSHNHVQSAVWKLLHYSHNLTVDDPTLRVDVAAFKGWRSCLSWQALQSKSWIKAFRKVAGKEAKHAEEKAARQAAVKFSE